MPNNAEVDQVIRGLAREETVKRADAVDDRESIQRLQLRELRSISASLRFLVAMIVLNLIATVLALLIP